MQPTVNDWLDQVACASLGDAFDDANPPRVFQVDPDSQDSTILMNNFFGSRFKGFNDMGALSDGYVHNSQYGHSWHVYLESNCSLWT